jgi:hypothetical protein
MRTTREFIESKFGPIVNGNDAVRAAIEKAEKAVADATMAMGIARIAMKNAADAAAKLFIFNDRIIQDRTIRKIADKAAALAAEANRDAAIYDEAAEKAAADAIRIAHGVAKAA